MSGFSYNAAGDLTNDGSYSYSWDAENRLTSAAGVTYSYDGDGQRVKKSSGTLYWRGGDGSVLAETDTSGNTTNEYIFFGARIARQDSSGNVYYYFGNHLAGWRRHRLLMSAISRSETVSESGQSLRLVSGVTGRPRATPRRNSD